MAGLYIHIPFCKQRCIYCDFFSTTTLNIQEELIDAECKELISRNKESVDPIQTIYLGGGTPSILHIDLLERLLNTIFKYYKINQNIEITIEANPDDITSENIDQWIKLGVNRISLGVQSFNNDILTFLKRRHNANQAIEAVLSIFNKGIENINIDLIYGIPGLSEANWKETLKQAFWLPIKHLSAYHLTIEKGTPLEKMCNKGKINEISENESIVQYKLLCEYANKHHFVHYEISNFALPNWHSKHNSAYWTGAPYIGIGPSAHSFDGYKIRRWNIANINKYIKHIDGKYFDVEYLSERDRFNEYLITRLRTQWGAYLDDLKKTYPSYFNLWFKYINPLIKQNLVVLCNNYLQIPQNHWFISDYILRKLTI